MNANPQRHRNKWGNAEVNRLHNEYELKRLTVQEIAALHKRTIYSIMYKLEEEGLISSSKWEEARGTATYTDTESTSTGTDPDMPRLMNCDESDAESVSLEQYLQYLEGKINRMETFLEEKFSAEYF